MFYLSKICISVLLLFVGFVTNGAAQTWTKVTAGGEFSVALRSDGTLWSWGVNMNGQLGFQSTDTYVLAPMQIGQDTDWADVVAGGFHVLALKSDGSLWAWGFNSVGQVGLPGEMQYATPVQVGTEKDWVSIEAGFASSAAIKSDGSLWMWGINGYGTLGNGSQENAETPVQSAAGTSWKQVACGGLHTMAIAEDGSLWGWGFSGNGQVGNGSVQHQLTPVRIGAAKWTAIDAGFEYSTGIQDDGTLWTWGGNFNGQLGTGNTTEQHNPVNIGIGLEFDMISAGSAFAFARTIAGEMYAWGANLQGGLGAGDAIDKRSPVSIPSLSACQQVVGATPIIAGQSLFGLHSLAIRGTAETICAAGANYGGQLGNGTLVATVSFDCTVNASPSSIESQPLSVSQFSVHLYPAPVRTEATITFESQTGDAISWTVYNVLGKVTATGEVEGSATITLPVQQLEPGMYVLAAARQDGTRRTLAFVVAR